MIYGIKYNSETGEIVMSLAGSEPSFIPLQEEPGFLTMETPQRVSGALFYVGNGEVVPRPVMPITMGSTAFGIGEVFRVDSIPEGTRLYHPDGDLVIDDGFFEWSSASEGDYTFALENFPYQREEIHAAVTTI